MNICVVNLPSHLPDSEELPMNTYWKLCNLCWMSLK